MPTLTTLVSFNGSDGNAPDGSLIADASGNLYGTTSDGGVDNYGTVFEIARTASGYASTATVLVTFDDTNGAFPEGSLTVDANGNLYGTTSGDGTTTYGTVFEVAGSPGSYATTPTILARFTASGGNTPEGNLIADAKGNLFGTTSDSAGSGYGTVFEIPITATGYGAVTTIASFNGTNGSLPDGSLIADSAGDLFGTTYAGGSASDGTVFEIVNLANGYASTPTTLATFTGPNGANPAGSLIMDSAGDLFGTTAGDGSDNKGTIFEIAHTAGGYAAPTILATFTGPNGAYPLGSLTMDAAGDLFGTTYGGGTYNDGTIFELASTGSGYASTVTTVASFDGTDGKGPSGTLSVDSAGDMFGTTYAGGASSYGTVFEVTNTSYAVSCFVRGTAILTDRGERPVEDLAIGDRVVTRSGRAEPIRWIGRRSYAGRFLAGRPELHPVLITAGALGGGLPRRDLRVSPLHAMFLGGALVPAALLVNGTTIRRDPARPTVDYLHIELADHAVIHAEGAPTETYLDDGSRAMFHNAAEYAQLYPDPRPSPARYCAPRLDSGPALQALVRRLTHPQAA